MKISQQIQQQREQRHWSQTDLAQRMNISRESISKWENNSALPSFANVVKLGELFDLSLDELIKGDASLMKKFDSHEAYPFKRLDKLIISIFGLTVVGYLLTLPFHLSLTNLHDWLLIPTIGMLIWLAFTLNWTQINKLMSRRTMIIAAICISLILIPILADQITGFIQGVTTGFRTGWTSLK